MRLIQRYFHLQKIEEKSVLRNRPDHSEKLSRQKTMEAEKIQRTIDGQKQIFQKWLL